MHESERDVLIFPQHGGLIGPAFGAIDRDKALTDVTTEHGAILHALGQRIEPDNTTLIQTDLIMMRNNRPGVPQTIVYSTPPDVPGYESVRLPSLDSYKGDPTDTARFERLRKGIYLRDLFTNIDGNLIFINDSEQRAFPVGKRVISSPLGEGGKVLISGKSVLVSPDLWKDPQVKRQISDLRNEEYKVLYIPFVEEEKQAKDKREFVPGHIDGHASLIQDRSGNPHLLYAKSYSRQGSGTSKSLRSTAEMIGAEPIEINDTGLPHLAFNLVQLPDGSVVMTSSNDSKELEDAVMNIVGEDQTVTTKIPVSQIPVITGAGIRCMTNIGPKWVLELFDPQPGRKSGSYSHY